MIIYAEAADVYHANEANGSTDIRTFLRSPTLYRDCKDGLKLKDTDALLFGTASHLAMLEPQRFATSVAIKPHGMHLGHLDGKAWKARQVGKTIISGDDADHLCAMVARMPAEVRAIFARCRTEVTVRTQIDGLPVQCRFDLWGDAETWDLKSIDAIENIERAIYKRGYHIQKRVYQRIEEAETGKPARPFGFLFVEKAPPYRWKIVEVDADYDAIADGEIDKALHGIGARMRSGCWDDPAPLRLIATPPAWMNGDDFTTNDDGGMDL